MKFRSVEAEHSIRRRVGQSVNLLDLETWHETLRRSFQASEHLQNAIALRNRSGANTVDR